MTLIDKVISLDSHVLGVSVFRNGTPDNIGSGKSCGNRRGRNTVGRRSMVARTSAGANLQI